MESMNNFYETDHLAKERMEFQTIKTAIELKSDQTEKPYVEISDFGLDEFSKLEKCIDEIKTEGNPGLVAVMRGWNLDGQNLESILQRINKIKEHIPALKGVTFVINGDADIDNVTENSLQECIREGKAEIPILPIKICNYTWTSGLNSAVSILNELALSKEIDRDKMKILNISYGVDLKESELVKCNESVKNNRFIITRRNTENEELPEENMSKELLWEKFKSLLRDPVNTDIAYVLRSMRNTFNVMTLSDIVKYGGFNPKTVSLGGMEDADFFMRMILHSLKSGDFEVIKKIKEAMNEPICYSDPRWVELRHKKDPSETAALRQVLSGDAIDENILNNEYVIPEDVQDFRMRLND